MEKFAAACEYLLARFIAIILMPFELEIPPCFISITDHAKTFFPTLSYPGALYTGKLFLDWFDTSHSKPRHLCLVS